jgi:hypothetical protein
MSKNFQSPSLFWWILIPGAFFIGLLFAHYPNVIPFQDLGDLGVFLSYLVTNYRMFFIIGIWALIVAHVYEAILARRICQTLNIDQGSTLLWTIQTFILGYPSLRILKGYARQRK